MMLKRLMMACSAIPLCFAHPATAQEDSGWQVPRTEWGDPDLRGNWPVDYLAQTPRQRPAHFGTRAELTDEEYEEALEAAREQLEWIEEEAEAGVMGMGHWIERGLPLRQTSLIVEPADGQYPGLTAAGREAASKVKTSWNNDTFDWMDDFGIFDRCITRGMPGSMLPGNYNSGIELYQAPGHVAIRLEMIHETRMVYLDGRDPPPASVNYLLGYSIGHWEDDTLVIETTNFAPGYSNGPARNSDQMHITERLTPVGPDEIHYEAWIADPVMLEEPYKLDFPWRRDAEYTQFEYACHEGNYSIRDYILATGTRFAARQEAAAKQVEARDNIPQGQ